MGKSEILMLLAGVALSIMLAMIAVPMFSSGNEMADRQQVQQELMAIHSAIPLIKALEGSEYTSGKGKITAENISRHMEGFKQVGSTDVVKGEKELAEFEIDDTIANNSNKNTITVTVTNAKVDLNKLSRLGSICVNVTAAGVVTEGVKGASDDYNVSADGKSLTGCKMKR